MKIKPIIKVSQTMAEQVLNYLEKEIMSGRYKPGDRLVEREIAEGLGVSRVPVREALIMLERWGFAKRNKKSREVAAFTRRDINELYQTLAIIEVAALYAKVMENDQKLFADLGEIIGHLDLLAAGGDVGKYRKVNSRFHHHIAEALNNRRLYEIYRDISRMERWFQSLTILHKRRMERSNAEHKRLLAACQSGDLAAVRGILEHHYGQAVEVICRSLPLIEA